MRADNRELARRVWFRSPASEDHLKGATLVPVGTGWEIWALVEHSDSNHVRKSVWKKLALKL